MIHAISLPARCRWPNDAQYAQDLPANWRRVIVNVGYPPTWERSHCGCGAKFAVVELLGAGRFRIFTTETRGGYDYATECGQCYGFEQAIAIANAQPSLCSH